MEHLANTPFLTAMSRMAVLFDTGAFLAAVIYSLIGIALFSVSFFVIVKVAPFSIRKEIEEDQNTALGIIIAAVFIGIALIISSAIAG